MRPLGTYEKAFNTQVLDNEIDDFGLLLSKASGF
jgi:hypothetical protein